MSDEAMNPGTPTSEAPSKASSRQEVADFYLKKHKIVELLHHITAELVYKTPEDPHTFIADYLEKLRSAKQTKSDYPCLFDEVLSLCYVYVGSLKANILNFDPHESVSGCYFISCGFLKVKKTKIPEFWPSNTP